MIFKEDVIAESIRTQRELCKQYEANFERFCTLDDKTNAWQTFWNFMQNRALLREMKDYADREGINY